MWVAVILLCSSLNFSSCYLTATSEGYVTEEYCREAIAKVSKDAEKKKLGGLGHCVFVKVDGERV